MPDPIETPDETTQPVVPAPITIMVDRNGDKYEVPVDQVQSAQQEYHLRPQSEIDQESAQKAAVEGRNAPGLQEGDLVDTMLDNFIGQGTLGASKILGNAVDTRSPEEKEIVAARKAATEEEHPILTGGSSLAGFAGSMLYGGGEAKIAKAGLGALLPSAIGEKVATKLAEAGAANVVTKVGQAIAKNTAIAGLYNAPSMVANLATGDPQSAAETLGATLKYGPVLGLVDLGIQGVAPKIISKIAPTTGQKLANIIVNNPGITFKDKTGKIISPDILINWATRTVKNGTLTNVLNDATESLQRNKEDADANFDTLTHTDPSQVSDSTVDAASKLGKANTSPVNPTQPFVNPQHVFDGIMGDISKDHNLFDTPYLSNLRGVFGEAGSNPITHAETDALRNRLEALPDHEMKDLALKHLDASQDASLDAAMSQLDSKKDILRQQAKQNLEYGNILQSQLPEEASMLDSFGNKVKDYAGKRYATNFITQGINSFAPDFSQIIKTLGNNMVDFPVKTIKKLLGESPELVSGLIARSLNEGMDAQIAKIPSILAGTTTAMERKDPLNSLLGGGVGLTQEQKYNKVTNAIINANSNPQSLSENYGQLLALFGSDPNLQNLITQHNTKAIQYLNTILPKNPNPPQPFTQEHWQPTKQQKNDFITQLSIVDNPMLAVHRIANGTITLKEMNTLKAVYPSLADKMTGQINSYAFSQEGTKASLAQQVAIAKATGTSIAAIKNSARTQSTFQQPTPSQNPNGSAPQPKHTNRNLKESKISSLTETQRLSNKASIG